MRLNETDIWSRTIREEVSDLSSAAANGILRVHLSDPDMDRIRIFSEEANAGTLNEQEKCQLDFYLNIARALEFLKVKARLSIQAGAGPANRIS